MRRILERAFGRSDDAVQRPPAPPVPPASVPPPAPPPPSPAEAAAAIENEMVARVAELCDRLPPDEALRFLFRLDARLYPLMGRKAIDYGGGLHTKHRHTRYHDFFVNNIRAEERVLDVGCGNGALTRDIAERSGARVIGIDVLAANIEAARAGYAHPRVEYRVGDALQPLDAGTFDVVVMSNVLEHLPGRPEFLRRLQQVTGAGRLLIRVPLFERDWRVPLKKELGVEWRLDPTHETEYTLESFAEEIAAAGLAIASQEVRWSEIWAVVRPAPAAGEQT